MSPPRGGTAGAMDTSDERAIHPIRNMRTPAAWQTPIAPPVAHAAAPPAKPYQWAKALLINKRVLQIERLISCFPRYPQH